MLWKMGNKILEYSNSFFKIAGGLLNGLVIFFNTALGSIGKLLSTAVVLFTMYLIWSAFQGQINNLMPVPDLAKLSGDELAKVLELRRVVYKEAIESVAGPLATLAGVVPAIIGAGIMLQKFIDKNKNGIDDREEQPPTVEQPSEQSNNEIKYQ